VASPSFHPPFAASQNFQCAPPIRPFFLPCLLSVRFCLSFSRPFQEAPPIYRFSCSLSLGAHRFGRVPSQSRARDPWFCASVPFCPSCFVVACPNATVPFFLEARFFFSLFPWSQLFSPPISSLATIPPSPFSFCLF